MTITSIKTYLNELKNSLRVGMFLGTRQIRRSSKGTTVLIIFIMILTFLNLVVVSGLLVGLISGSFKQFRESYSGDVIITPAPGRDYIENSPGLISLLKNHEHVIAIAPRHGMNAVVRGTPNVRPLKDERINQVGARLTGINIEEEEKITHFSRFIQYGSPLKPDDSNGILIGANLIKKYSTFADAAIPGLDLLKDVDVGSRVQATITTKDGEKITKDFFVRGIVKSKVDQISTRMFVVDDELKRLIPSNQEQVQEIAIKTTPATYAPILVQELKTYMGTDNLALIQTSLEAVPSFLRDVEATFAILGNALSSFALIVASITIFIVIFINAVTKRKFIGIMKGIGISPLAVQTSYLIQGLFYAVTGSVIGLLLTFGLLKPYFDIHPINFPFSDGILAATPEGAAIRVAILLFVTIVASYVPAKIIVRKNTLDSILGR